MAKVLSVCLKDIERCQTRMIVLIGDRYGSVPSSETLMHFIKNSASDNYSEADLLNKSVTEIEIIHGLLRQSLAPDHITLCFRDPLVYGSLSPAARKRYDAANETERESLRRLKETLISKYPDQILFYSVSWDGQNQCIGGLDAFVEQITHRLIRDIDSIIPSGPICEEERIYNLQAAAFSSAQNQFCGRSCALAYFDEYMADKGQNLFLLCGSCGMGKSYLCSGIIALYGKRCHVIPVSVCRDGYRLSALQLLKQFVWIAENLAGETNHFNRETHAYEEWRNEARQLILGLSKEKTVLIVMDDIDKLHRDEHADAWDFLPFYSNAHVKVLVSAQNGYRLSANTRVNYRITRFNMTGMEEDEIQQVIVRNLHALHKEAPSYVLDALSYAARYRSPYYLRILMHRIVCLSESDYIRIDQQIAVNPDANANLYRYIQNIISETPATEKQALLSCLHGLGMQFHESQAKRLFNWIRCTSHGLRLDDLYRLFEAQIPVVDLSHFVHLSGIILQYDEMSRVCFRNSIAREAVESYLECDWCDIAAARAELLGYLAGLPDLDQIKEQEFAPLCLQCNRSEAAARYIARAYNKEDLKREASLEGGYAYNRILSSIKNAVYDPGYEGIDLYAALTKMIDEARYFPHEECYGFVSAILFSFDLMFASFSDAEKESIMLRLYKLAIERIYPYREQNLYYLRMIYVCCEQCGIRTTDFLLRRNMYNEFLRYCLELFERMPKGFAYRNNICHDLSIAYEKQAVHNFKSHTGRAMEIFGKALECAEMLSPSASDYDRLKKRKYDVLLSRASAVIEHEMLVSSDASSFWDENRLQMVLRDLPPILEYYRAEPRTLETKRSIQKALLLLANGSHCLKDYRKEYMYWLSTYHTSKEICAESASAIDLDLFRVSLMGLESCPESDASSEQRMQWLAETMDCSRIILKGIKSGNERYLKMLFFASDRYLKLGLERIAQCDPIDTAGHQRDGAECSDVVRIADMILDMQQHLSIGNVKQILHAPVDDSTYESFNKSFMEFLGLVRKYQILLHALSKKAFGQRDYGAAIQNDGLALEMCRRQEGFRRMEALLSDRLDICYLLMACCHNSRQWNLEDYYSQMIANDCLLYDCLRPENTVTEHYKRILKDFCFSDTDTLDKPIAWTALLCHAIDDSDNDPACSLFWNAVERQNYAIGGQKNHYSHLEITDNRLRDQNDAHCILPQEDIERAGAYLCEHIRQERVLRLLYRCDWFECLALEYAYRHDLPDVAGVILENGYDDYLELPLLYILRKYDRFEYDVQMKKLKLVCHCKHVSTIKRRLRNKIQRTKQDAFYDDYMKAAKRIIHESKHWSENDPRRRIPRTNIVF